MGWPGAHCHEVEHFDAGRIEGSDDNALLIRSVPASAWSDVDRFAAFAEQLAHQFHRAPIVELFFHFLLRGVVDVRLEKIHNKFHSYAKGTASGSVITRSPATKIISSAKRG